MNIHFVYPPLPVSSSRGFLVSNVVVHLNGGTTHLPCRIEVAGCVDVGDCPEFAPAK